MNYDLTKLEYNYGKTSDDVIKELLKRVDILTLDHKGIGTIYGYYTLPDNLIANINNNPRGHSHTFNQQPINLVENLIEFRRVPFLVKSSSRFYLKPDIGEVFDQLTADDKAQVKGIYTPTDHECVSDCNYVLEAVLLK